MLLKGLDCITPRMKYHTNVKKKLHLCLIDGILVIMFQNYLAGREDFEAIEEGIAAVWRPELNFIFKDKNLLKNVVVISFDSRYLHLWTKANLPKLEILPLNLKDYHFYRIRHQIKFSDEDQLGWMVGLKVEKMADYLPKNIIVGNYQFPKISGGLLSPFIKSHQNRKAEGFRGDAYDTRESYLATIVHEFGHVYYDQHKLFWYSSKKENLTYLNTALKLYEGKKTKEVTSIRIPSYRNLSELFAFCTDYTTASLFWPNHKKDIDKANIEMIKWQIKEEKKRNLDIQDSALESWPGGHVMAMGIGKILLSQFPKTWPKKTLSVSPKISLH